MSKTRRPIVEFAVYVVVRSMICLLQALPPASGAALARAIGTIGYWIDRRHRRVAEANLKIAFGDQWNDRRRRRAVRNVYEHFARMIVEMTWIPRRLNAGNWKKYCDVQFSAPSTRGLLSKRACIIVTGHFGNWEMAGYTLAACGIHGYAIARTLDNPHLNRFLLRFRQKTGQTVLSKTGDYERIEQALRDGEVLITVADQSAGPKGCFVDFFGKPASTHKSVALLAQQFDAVIMVGYAYRVAEPFRYRIVCEDPIDPRDFADDPKATVNMTQAFTATLERAVRRDPEQYFWLHNRWKHDPPVRKSSRARPEVAEAA